MQRQLFLTLVLLLLSTAVSLAQNSGRVSWVYDGDSLRIEGIGKVRLLGIDTPEHQGSKRDDFYRDKFGIAPQRLRRIARWAKEFNISQVKGKQLRIETERQQHDRHGRLLVYAYLPDGRLLNALLLEEGLATVFRRFDFRRKKEFLKLEAAARTARKGLWQD